MNQRKSFICRTATISALGFALTAIPTVASAVTVLTAVLNSNGTIARAGQTGTTSARIGQGSYKVIFNRNVNTCTYVATVGSPNTTKPQGGNAKVSSLGGNARGVAVGTGQQGTPSDNGFHLIVVCP